MKYQLFIPALIVTGSISVATGCGSAANLAANGKTATATQGAAAGAKLTDDASTATAAADTTAQKDDAGSDGDKDSDAAAPALPAFLEAVKAARDYTRTLLGISDQPLKDFKAAVEAARALATDKADFQAKIEPAQDALKLALDEQRVAVDKARVDHKAQLDGLFNATKAVFLACAPDVAMGAHQPRRGDDDGDGPVVMIGGGEIKGDFADLKGKARESHVKHPPKPRGHGRRDEGPQGRGDQGGPGGWQLADATSTDTASATDTATATATATDSFTAASSSAGDECTAATASLLALIPAAPAGT